MIPTRRAAGASAGTASSMCRVAMLHNAPWHQSIASCVRWRYAKSSENGHGTKRRVISKTRGRRCSIMGQKGMGRACKARRWQVLLSAPGAFEGYAGAEVGNSACAGTMHQKNGGICFNKAMGRNERCGMHGLAVRTQAVQ